MKMKAVDMNHPRNMITRRMQNNYLGNKLNFEQLENIVNNLTKENDYFHERLRCFGWKAAENESSVGYFEKEAADLNITIVIVTILITRTRLNTISTTPTAMLLTTVSVPM